MLWLRMSSSLTELSMIFLVPSSKTRTFQSFWVVLWMALMMATWYGSGQQRLLCGGSFFSKTGGMHTLAVLLDNGGPVHGGGGGTR
jgi:hypothetical protein